MISPAETIRGSLEHEALSEKSRFTRFEHLSELFTYILAATAVFLSLLPTQTPYHRLLTYVFAGLVAAFSLAWFRVLPKKYSGKTKNVVYYFLNTLFVGVLVYLNQGVQSPATFLFYLICIAAASSLSVKEAGLLTGFSDLIILTEAMFIRAGIPLEKSLGLGFLHIWALTATAIYAWFVFKEEKKSREAHKVDHLGRIKEFEKIKDEFVFIISTKLAAPVITLKDYIGLALSKKLGPVSEDQKDILTKTEENISRLHLLVEDLLDLSKIETGKLSLNLSEVDVGQVVGATLSDFTVQATDKKISLSFDGPEEKVLVKGDTSRIHEVVANLVDNSIKYSPPGSKVEVRFSRQDGFVQVDVSNNGPSIPEVDKKYIFQKFYRGAAVKKGIKGSGLGLFICKELIERQGGTMWFDSRAGVGTTFSFKLPEVVNE